MSQHHPTHRSRPRWIAITGLCTVGAVVTGAVGLAVTGPHTPGRAGAPMSAATAPSTAAHTVPRLLTIPSIGVREKLVELSVAHDRTMELPPTDGVGWYDGSASPGDPGAAVVTGFIRVAGHRGALARLGELRPGSKVSILRSDGASATYTVDRIDSYSPKDFPVTQVYGATTRPTLRIVTTGGTLRPGDPAGNVVVYGSLSRFQTVNNESTPMNKKK